MTIFDLAFIAAFFASAIMLVAALVSAVRGRKRQAVGSLLSMIVFIAAYLMVVAVVSLRSPARALYLREPQCFDDWCISVDEVERTVADTDALYTTKLRIFSRARGRAQRENGVSVYLLDDRGSHYEPIADPQDIPLNVLLHPGESISLNRRFDLPAAVGNPGLVVAHGRFPGMFIIGDPQSLFHKASVVRFQ